MLPHTKIQWTNDSIKLLGTVIPNDRSTLSELNYSPKLKKIEQIINIWRQRNLTLYGRVQLIKTYLISQIVYLLAVLPAPSIDFIKQLESILFKFLWNNKTERIKRTTLYQSLAEGGITMPHLPSFNYALKLAWLRRLLDQENKGTWKSLFMLNLPLSEQYVWNCNLMINDVCSLKPYLKNNFWKEVVEAWCIYNFHEPTDITGIRTQNVWFNSFIKVDNKTLFHRDWYNSGVETITDLLDGNGKFLPYVQFVNKYNLRINYLSYYSLISAIPVKWKQLLNSESMIENDESKQSRMQQLMKFKKVCREGYSIFLEHFTGTDLKLKGVMKWETELDCSLDIQSTFKNIYSCTRATKLQSCQYHLVHKSLVTNVDLLKFCNNEPETLVHLMVNCTRSTELWEHIKQWLRQKSGINMHITTTDIMFGCIDEFSILFDLVFMVAKQYIYSSRCNSKPPNFIEFLYKLRAVKELEYECAKLYGKLNLYENKWLPLTDAFDNL
jgi:hypothetical protein